jgi:hypothetical protein
LARTVTSVLNWHSVSFASFLIEKIRSLALFFFGVLLAVILSAFNDIASENSNM